MIRYKYIYFSFIIIILYLYLLYHDIFLGNPSMILMTEGLKFDRNFIFYYNTTVQYCSSFTFYVLDIRTSTYERMDEFRLIFFVRYRTVALYRKFEKKIENSFLFFSYISLSKKVCTLYRKQKRIVVLYGTRTVA